MSEKILKDKGVVRVHGPGFEGTIQVFVENDYARKYKNEILFSPVPVLPLSKQFWTFHTGHALPSCPVSSPTPA